MPRPFRLVPLLPAAACLWIAAAGGAVAAGGEDWPQWRGPGRTGAAALPAGVGLKTAAPEGGLRPAWTADLGGGFEGGWASPVVAGGRVFVATAGRVKREGVKLPPPQFPKLSDEEEAALPAAEAEEYETKQRAESLERRKALFTGRETLHCLDAATGERLWADARDTPVTRFPQSSTPAVATDDAGGGTVVLLGGDRVLRALDAATGAERWRTTLPGEFDAEQLSSSPLITTEPGGGGRVFVQAGSLFAVNLADGAVAWESDAVDGRDGSPAAFGPWVIANGDGETVAVAAADGAEAWRLEDTGASRSSPVVTDTPAGPRLLTFGSSRKGGLRCYDLARLEGRGGPPELLWKYQKLSDPGASPVVAGGLALVTGDRRLDCVDLATGAGLWTARLDLAKPRFTSPAAVVAGGEGGDVGGVGLYTFGRLLAFDLTGEDYRPRFDLSVGPGAVAKPEGVWKEELGIDTADGDGLARFDAEVTKVGLLPCASPAVSAGRVYVRLETALACYDLTE